MMGGQKPHHGASEKSLSKPTSPSTARTREAPTPTGVGESVDWPDSDLFRQAVAFASQNRRVSISILEREFRIGFNEAEQLIEQMYAVGVVARPAPRHEREIAPIKKNDRFSREKSDSLSSAQAPKIVIKDVNGTIIANGELYEYKNYASYSYEDVTSGAINTDIENIDNSFTESDIQALVADALTPLLARTELNAEQKAEIIRVSSTSFKAHLDGNHGVSSGEVIALPDVAPHALKTACR